MTIREEIKSYLKRKAEKRKSSRERRMYELSVYEYNIREYGGNVWLTHNGVRIVPVDMFNTDVKTALTKLRTDFLSELAGRDMTEVYNRFCNERD